MAGIGADLLKRLQSVLLECGPFASDAELRTIFVDARISAWRDDLPEANSLANRVNALIAYLADKPDPKQISALNLFLHVLADSKAPDDACRQQLLTLAEALESDPQLSNALVEEVKRQEFRNQIRSLPLWLKLLLPISLLTLVLVVYLTINGSASLIPPSGSQSAPSYNDMEWLKPHELDALQLALEYVPPDTNRLWVAARSSDGQAVNLYRLQLPWQDRQSLELVIQQIPGTLWDMTIDCRGNVWLALENPPDGSGVRVYDPRTHSEILWLNSDTTQHWLAKNTVFSIASRCNDDNESVEIWLGREGVHTLRYTDTPENIVYISWEKDPVYSLTRTLADITDMYYDGNNQILWGIDREQKKLFQISLRDSYNPAIIDLNDNAPIALTGGNSAGVWIAGVAGLTLVQPPDDISIFQPSEQPFAIASTHQQTSEIIWLGTRTCTSLKSEECSPLYWWQTGKASGPMHSIRLDDRKEVRSIVVDAQQGVWIATENGLLFYDQGTE